MKKINLFVVGAARSGTTSLWRYLNEHPEIFMPSEFMHKEPAYFSEMKNTGLDYEDYLNLFSEAKNEKYLGEASTAYLTDPDSAQLIHNYNPSAKIIIILRNPAERAYSLYRWMTQEGYEWAGSFEKALDLEDKRKDKEIPNFFEPEYYWNYMYFRSGLYYEQVKRYLDFFDENVLILKFSNLKNSPETTYRTLCEFLELNPYVLSFDKHNVSQAVIFPKLQFVLRKITNIYLKRAEKFNIKPDKKNNRDLLIHWGSFLSLSKNSLSEDLYKKLISEYSEDIEKLEDLTNIKFMNWLL